MLSNKNRLSSSCGVDACRSTDGVLGWIGEGNKPYMLTSIFVCALSLLPVKNTLAASQTVQTLTVSASESVLRSYVEVNQHSSATGFRMDSQGNVYFAYGDDIHINMLQYNKGFDLWASSLVGDRSKKIHLPSLAMTSNGDIYLHAMDYDRTGTYNSVSDSALYYLSANPGSGWTKLQDIYSDRASEAAGAADIARYIFADPSDNLHIGLIRDGWWSYGYKQSEMIYDTASNTLGPQITISDRRASHPDHGRNNPFPGSGGAVFLGDHQELQIPLFDFDTQTVFLAQSDVPYGSWTQNDLATLSFQSGGGYSAFQDAQGHHHALMENRTSGHVAYTYDWGDFEDLAPVWAADMIVRNGTVIVLLAAQPTADGCDNLFMMVKPQGGVWSAPIQQTFESNKVACSPTFAKPFGYRQEPTEVYFQYSVMDGTPSGGSYTNSHIKIVKMTPPTSPSVTGTTPTNDATPTWEWVSAGGGNGTFRYMLDDDDMTGSTVTTATSFTPAAPLTEGSHTLYVQEQSEIGDWSTAGSKTLVLDLTPPDTIIKSGPAALTKSTSATFKFSTAGGSQYRCQLDGNAYESCVSAKTYTKLAAGSHMFTVKSIDAVGNEDPTPATYGWTIDTIPPAPPLVTGMTTNNVQPKWSWVSGGNGGSGVYRYRFDRGVIKETTEISFIPNTGLSAGNHSLYVQERDEIGNWSSFSKETLVIQ